jgi:threonine synthase
MPRDIKITCIDCGHETTFSMPETKCPQCGSEWREASYNYQEIGKALQANLSNRTHSLWRYHELLPIEASMPDVSLGEGATPLYRAANLGMMLGCPNIYIKDERQGPTSSFKDRQAVVTIAALKEAGIKELVLASTGNVAIAYSAYAARAGIKLWAFLTSRVPAEKMREVALYGTQVIKVTGSYDQTKQVAADFATQRGIFHDLGAKCIPCIESMKTIAFEISEQLTSQLGAPQDAAWRTPDWYFQSVSGGMGPLGVIKGFRELAAMGLTSSVLPKLGVIQAAGCAPMVHAWKKDADVAEPVTNPRTLIETLATGTPGRTYTRLREKMQEASGGTFESVTDEETFRAIHLLAKMEGVSVEPAAAVAVAGLIKLIRQGIVKPEETVVINCTGHTMPIEPVILGDSLGSSVDLTNQNDEPEEGLLAAINQITSARYPRVAIIDDNADARRLIRRILQSQGEYTIFEADNGRKAIDIITTELPDLVLLDLMMPELDGFDVMDALQKNQQTADIPIIVVTAKELTVAEKKRLNGHIQLLLQKGNFLSDDLENEVRSLLK